MRVYAYLYLHCLLAEDHIDMYPNVRHHFVRSVGKFATKPEITTGKKDMERSSFGNKVCACFQVYPKG